MSIIIPRREVWTSQPPIGTLLDHSAWETKGLQATINPRVGKLCLNDVTGARLANNTYGLTQIVDKRGQLCDLSTGNVSGASYVISTISGFTTQSDCTIIAVVEGNTDTATVNYVELMDNALGGYVSLSICAGDGTNARWVGRIRLAGVSYLFGSAPETAVTSGKSYVVCAVHKRNVSQSLFVNGIKSSAGLTQTGNFDYAPDSATLGRTASRYAGFTRFYNRALTDQEVVSLSSAIWRGFQP